MTTKFMENANLKKTTLEMVYKAILYTVRGEGVAYDEKHDEMADVLCHSNPEIDVTDLPDLLDEIYEQLKSFEDIAEHFKSVCCMCEKETGQQPAT